MVRRNVVAQVRLALRRFPAVALVGPRQCGKTTLARALGGVYFDLEQPGDRLRLDLSWEQLRAGRELVILDEAHAWPEVFSRLRGTIDNDRTRNGRFLLLGSVSPALMTQVSESLAGRLALIELTPLTWAELKSKARQDRAWLVGGFPDGGILSPRSFPRWQQDYLALITQRDLPAWGLPAKPQVTLRLLAMLASLHGQLWNASAIGAGLGLSYHTVNTYLDFLVGAYLIRRLAPYHANIGKRLVKNPKVYWRDSGLLHATLGVASQPALLNQPWAGFSWEGFVIEQVLNHLSSHGRVVQPYHFRTSDQYEIDLVVDVGAELWAFEIKLTSAPDPRDMERLGKAADMIGARRRVLVSQTPQLAGNDRILSCNLESLLDRVAKW